MKKWHTEQVINILPQAVNELATMNQTGILVYGAVREFATELGKHEQLVDLCYNERLNFAKFAIESTLLKLCANNPEAFKKFLQECNNDND